mgnify:FL=1
MTKTQYYNCTVIIRQALDYAADLKLILENPFKYVKIDGKRMFRKVKKKPERTVPDISFRWMENQFPSMQLHTVSGSTARNMARW